MEAEDLGGNALVAAGAREGVADHPDLECPDLVGERKIAAGGIRFARPERRRQAQDLVGPKTTARSNDVAQLAHVPRPVVGSERGQGFAANRSDVAAEARRLSCDEVLDEQRDVLAALAQRRELSGTTFSR